MAGQRWSVRRETDARGMAPPAIGWTHGPNPYAFGHVHGYGAVPSISELENAGWQLVGEVPGLVGLWVMRRDNVE